MEKWEYAVDSDVFYASLGVEARFMERINGLGKKGWEAVGATVLPFGHDRLVCIVFLKRKIAKKWWKLGG